MSRNKLLAIFLILWAATLFVWGLSNIMRYPSDLSELSTGEDRYWIGLLGTLAGLADLATGVVLALLATKLWGTNLVASLTRNKLLAIFLILWAASFFFWGLYDITDWAEYAAESAEALVVTSWFNGIGCCNYAGIAWMENLGSKRRCLASLCRLGANHTPLFS